MATVAGKRCGIVRVFCVPGTPAVVSMLVVRGFAAAAHQQRRREGWIVEVAIEFPHWVDDTFNDDDVNFAASWTPKRNTVSRFATSCWFDFWHDYTCIVSANF
jgi:hypothetical protein